MDSYNENSRYSIEDLILMGVAEVAGIDSETGEVLYNFKNIDDYPDIHDAWEEAFHRELMFFWQEGFIDMNVTALNPVIRITPKGVSDAAINSLSPEQRKMFVSLRELFKKNPEV